MSQMKRTVADTLYVNGKIYTMDSCKPRATCLGIKGDKIVYVGGATQAEFFKGIQTKVIDLGGRAVYPGFNESHMHIMMYAEIFWELTFTASLRK